jgi:hypothetical protein
LFEDFTAGNESERKGGSSRLANDGSARAKFGRFAIVSVRRGRLRFASLATLPEALRMHAIENQIAERREHPVDVVERLAALQEWAFDRHDANEIAILVTGVWAHYEVAITWIPEVESLHFSCAFELKTPERKRAEIGELIGLINAQTWLGHFDLWPAENVVMFRHAHCLAGGAQAGEPQCRALVEAAIKTCETYYQAFQFVLWASRKPRAAMEFAMFETEGTA